MRLPATRVPPYLIASGIAMLTSIGAMFAGSSPTPAASAGTGSRLRSPARGRAEEDVAAGADSRLEGSWTDQRRLCGRLCDFRCRAHGRDELVRQARIVRDWRAVCDRQMAWWSLIRASRPGPNPARHCAGRGIRARRNAVSFQLSVARSKGPQPLATAESQSF